MNSRPSRLPSWAFPSSPGHARRGTPTDFPATAYARRGDTHIAYQVAGEGQTDLILVLGASSSSTAWEEPASSLFLQRLTTFSRLVTFDQRGSGRSDPLSSSQLPTLEERADDLLAVMDAANLERAALFGTSDGGAVSMMFAATYPERVTALVLANTWVRLVEDEDFPWGHPAEILEAAYRIRAEIRKAQDR